MWSRVKQSRLPLVLPLSLRLRSKASYPKTFCVPFKCIPCIWKVVQFYQSRAWIRRSQVSLESCHFVWLVSIRIVILVVNVKSPVLSVQDALRSLYCTNNPAQNFSSLLFKVPIQHGSLAGYPTLGKIRRCADLPTRYIFHNRRFFGQNFLLPLMIH